MTKNPTAELFKKLVQRPARTAPAPDPPLIGTVHDDDARMILSEYRLRHRVELIRDEPEAALEEPAQRPAEAARAAPVGRPPAGPTSDPEDEDESAEEDARHRSRMRKLKLRLARLEAEISKLGKGKSDAKKAEK